MALRMRSNTVPCVSPDQQHHWAWAPWRREKICVRCALRARLMDEEMATEPWRHMIDSEGEDAV